MQPLLPAVSSTHSRELHRFNTALVESVASCACLPTSPQADMSLPCLQSLNDLQSSFKLQTLILTGACSRRRKSLPEIHACPCILQSWLQGLTDT